MQRKRKGFSYKQREAFADAHGRKCAACGKEDLISQRDAKVLIEELYRQYKNSGKSVDELRKKEKEIKGRQYAIDHIVPFSRGGSCDDSNLRLLCVTCNAIKGDLPEDEFIDRVNKRKEIPALIKEVASLLNVDENFLSSTWESRDSLKVHALLTEIKKLGKEAGRL